MSVFANVKGQGEWLIDTGNRETAERLMKPFLRSRGVDRLSGIVLTHGDSLHVGGAARLAQDFSPKEVLTTCVPQRSTVYRKVLKELSDSGRPVRLLKRGDRVGPWRVLHPGLADRFSRGDDSALVLLGDFGGARLLVLSDLGYEGQKALLEHTGDLRADVIVAGLPSLGEPLGEALLDDVCPKTIVLCDTDSPFNGSADASLRARLHGRGIPVHSTQSSGVVSLSVREGDWCVSTAAETGLLDSEPNGAGTGGAKAPREPD
jgi:competence protein ComEC